jgi:hypothetical protein
LLLQVNDSNSCGRVCVCVFVHACDSSVLIEFLHTNSAHVLSVCLGSVRIVSRERVETGIPAGLILLGRSFYKDQCSEDSER